MMGAPHTRTRIYELGKTGPHIQHDLSDFYLTPDYFSTHLKTESLIQTMADAQVQCVRFMGKFVPRDRKI